MSAPLAAALIVGFWFFAMYVIFAVARTGKGQPPSQADPRSHVRLVKPESDPSPYDWAEDKTA